MYTIVDDGFAILEEGEGGRWIRWRRRTWKDGRLTGKYFQNVDAATAG